MSLKSDYELSSNPEFRGKVLLAIGKIASNVIESDTNKLIRKAFMREVLKNVHHYADRLYIIVAADGTIDTSSTDDIIQQVVRKVLLSLSEE